MKPRASSTMREEEKARVETWQGRGARLLRDAHAYAQVGNIEEALISANGGVEALRVEIGECEPPEGVDCTFEEEADR